MPMNRIEQMLSDAADVVQQRLREDAKARADLEQLLRNGRKPFVDRVLTEPDASCHIEIGPPIA